MLDFFKDKEFIFDVIIPISVIGLAVIFIAVIIVVPVSYYRSCREAKIFNARYETNYSCGDFFWARSQIQQQVQTIRLEGLEKELK